MATLDELGAWIAGRLPELLIETKVPGAAVGVYAAGQVIDHAAGVLSTATGVEATPDSVFQVGSITKSWTASMIMQMVDDGLLDLDATVRTYLPDFHLADDGAAATITVRQLTCHTAGFEGDLFTDTGKGDDAVEKFVATLGETSQLFAPGEMFSYNNAGYCVLGRIVEVLRGKPYADCLRERLFTPLGLTHAANGPYEAIMHRAAIGHITKAPDADPEPAPVYALVRSNEPAGSMLAMRARDLLAFAAMHLNSGVARDGAAVISDSSVSAMRERQVDLPPLGMLGDAWGIGWEIFDDPGGTVIGHDGSTLGQNAFLRLVPGRDVAVAVLTNGGNPFPIFTEIAGRALRELAGVEIRPLPTPPAQPLPIDTERYVGSYTSDVADTEVSVDADGRVWIERRPKGVFAELGEPPTKTELVGYQGDLLLSAEPAPGLNFHLSYAFVGDDGSGRALYVHTGRADRRAGV